MANHVEFQDFSFEVREALNATSIGWLYGTAEEIKSQAQRNCKTDYEEGGKQLKGSYAYKVDQSAGEAQVGSPMEAAYWEEWGTGEYAAHGDGRPGWWIYTPDDQGPTGYKSNTYYDEMEAMMMAAYIQQKYGKRAYVTNGRKPNYTLENAFNATKTLAIVKLERLLRERMGT